MDTPSLVSVHSCSANPDILNHDARLNDVSPNDASPNDVSCPSCSPHRTGYSSVTPETNLFPGSHGLLSVHFPSVWMSIPLKHPNRNCFPLQHFFHTQRTPILLYRQIRKSLPSSCFPSPFLILHEHWLYFYSIDPPLVVNPPPLFPYYFLFLFDSAKYFQTPKSSRPTLGIWLLSVIIVCFIPQSLRMSKHRLCCLSMSFRYCLISCCQTLYCLLLYCPLWFHLWNL